MNAAAGFLGKAAAKARGDLQDLQRKSNQLGLQVSLEHHILYLEQYGLSGPRLAAIQSGLHVSKRPKTPNLMPLNTVEFKLVGLQVGNRCTPWSLKGRV